MSALGYGAAVGQAAIDALTARLNGVDTSLAAKADTTMVQGGLASKANASDLAAKANMTDLPPNVQTAKIQVAGNSGIAVWTFAQAFDVAPICAAVAETPAGASYVNVASIVEGTTTKTETQFVVQRVVKTITLPTLATSLLGLVLTLFGFAPAGVYVNCFARRPS